MYSVSVQKDPKNSSTVEFIFSGELIIENIEEIATEIRGQLGDYDVFRITTKDVDDMDLSFVQLIISLERTLIARKKEVLKNIQVQESLSELFENTGFETIIA